MPGTGSSRGITEKIFHQLEWGSGREMEVKSESEVTQ